jgi:hypothetical protein
VEVTVVDIFTAIRKGTFRKEGRKEGKKEIVGRTLNRPQPLGTQT